LIDLALAGLFCRKRQFRTHALRMMTGIHPSLRVVGEEFLPRSGPGVITVNHYNSPTFWTPWFPAAISAMVPVDINWTMSEAWTYPGRRFGRFYRSLSQWMLTRVAGVYGFNSMPPMPPAPGEVTRRSAAVARLMSYVRAQPKTLIGMAPEGGDQPGAVLSLPPSGFGKLALAFSRLDLLFFPVGAYEEDGCFCIRFGQPYRLYIVQCESRDQLDVLARRTVMDKIAGCLPVRLRGEFSDD
jgi:hypothetical protein